MGFYQAGLDDVGYREIVFNDGPHNTGDTISLNSFSTE